MVLFAPASKFFHVRDTVTEHFSAPAKPFWRFGAKRLETVTPSGHVADLDSGVSIGTRVIVLPMDRRAGNAGLINRRRLLTLMVRRACAVSNHEAPATRHLSLILRDALKCALPGDEEEPLPVNSKNEM